MAQVIGNGREDLSLFCNKSENLLSGRDEVTFESFK